MLLKFSVNMLNLYSVIFDDNEIYAKDFEKPLSAQDFVLPFLGRIEKCRINFKVKLAKNLYLKVLQIYLTFPKLHVRHCNLQEERDPLEISPMLCKFTRADFVIMF